MGSAQGRQGILYGSTLSIGRYSIKSPDKLIQVRTKHWHICSPSRDDVECGEVGVDAGVHARDQTVEGPLLQTHVCRGNSKKKASG